MSKKVPKLPGKVCRVLSFLPYANCLALVHLGFTTSKRIHILCAIFYASVYITQPSAFYIIWGITFLHYSIAHFITALLQNQKRKQTNLKRRHTNQSIVQKNRDLTSLYKKPNQSRTPKYNRAPQALNQNTNARTLTTTYTSPQHKTNHFGGSDRQKFFMDMKKYEDFEGKKATFIPFQCNWPNYDNMNRLQKEWYFYWRSEVRKKNYIETDLSYIFLYVYELLSSCGGYSDPRDGAIQLIDVWKQYQNSFPKLDDYLPAWIFDYLQVHLLDSMIFLGDNRIKLNPSVRADQMISQYEKEIPLKLPFPLINVLCDHEITNSKFYKDGNANLMQEAIPRVIALADATLRKSSGKGLLDTYGPAKENISESILFESAICPRAGEKIKCKVKNYTTEPKLREYINNLVRTGENTLRSIYGYHGRLRGITLSQELTNRILVFLKKEYEPSKVVKPQEDKVTKIVLDFESIEQLRTESEEVREALKVEEPMNQTQKALLTDVLEVSAIYTSISDDSRTFLAKLRESDWEMEKEEKQEDIINEINRVSERYLGCSLLAIEEQLFLVEEDYRDELEYVLDTPPVIPEDQKDEIVFNEELLTPELAQLVQALMPEQQQVIMLLLTLDHAKEEIEKLAEESMTMPEILYDGINELAMQIVGDLLIDRMEEEPRIIEEYYEVLINSIGA